MKRIQIRQNVHGRNLSKSRIIVSEALVSQGKDGATKEDLLILVGDEIGGSRPQGAIGLALSSMAYDGEVVEHRGRWYLKECAPDALISHVNGSNSSAAPAPAMNGHKAQVAPFIGKRTGKTVSLYTGHRVFDDVVAIMLLVGGRWWPVMLGDKMRIMVAFEAPQWSPDQVIYSDVEVIKFTHKDGGVYEERPAPKDLVTIAPGE